MLWGFLGPGLDLRCWISTRGNVISPFPLSFRCEFLVCMVRYLAPVLGRMGYIHSFATILQMSPMRPCIGVYLPLHATSECRYEK